MRLPTLALTALLLVAAASGARVAPASAPAPAPKLAAPAPAPAAAPGWAKPAWCKELECPEFTVVHRSPDASVEVRDYAPSVWATTSLPAGVPWQMARSDGFKRLFDYISAHGIAMTTPVVYRVSPGPDGAMKAAFLLPQAARATAPRADGPVTVEEWPAMRVAARSWAGSPDGRGVVDRQASEAAKTAAAAGFGTAAPQSSPYYFAGYDGPMTPAAARRHEVWVPVTAAPPSVAPQVAMAG